MYGKSGNTPTNAVTKNNNKAYVPKIKRAGQVCDERKRGARGKSAAVHARAISLMQPRRRRKGSK